jgi:hypothetical protein
VLAITEKVLPRNRLGHDEETTGKQRKTKRLSVFSNAARILPEIEELRRSLPNLRFETIL